MRRTATIFPTQQTKEKRSQMTDRRERKKTRRALNDTLSTKGSSERVNTKKGNVIEMGIVYDSACSPVAP